MGADTRDSVTEFETAGYPPDTEHRIGQNEQPSHAVAAAVGDALGCRPEDVPPLHDTIDLDALGALFETKHDGTPRMGGRITFVHGDCEVVVGPEWVRVYREH